MEITITAGNPPRRVTAPLSKSEGHRAMILAALAEGETLLPVLPASDDMTATKECLRQMGAGITETAQGLQICPIRAPAANAVRLNCGESGSTLRFLLPVAAALGRHAVFTGAGRLPERPVAELLEAMQKNGITAEVRREPWEIEIDGRLTAGIFTLPGNVSSQYVSGLLMALPLLKGSSEIRVEGALQSAGYAAMTEEMLRRFGAVCEKTPQGWHIAGGQRYHSPMRFAIGGDWSQAAFWLAAGSLFAPVTVTGLLPESAQPDRAILPLLRQMGAQIEISPNGVTAAPGKLRGISAEMSGCPDLLPPLAVVMAFAEGESRLTGAGRLRLKESDRLTGTAGLLRALGGTVTELPDGLVIAGGGLRGGAADPCGDHRLAMAAGLAALGCREPVTVKNAECVRKSYPEWWEILTGNEKILSSKN